VRFGPIFGTSARLGSGDQREQQGGCESKPGQPDQATSLPDLTGVVAIDVLEVVDLHAVASADRREERQSHGERCSDQAGE